MSWGACKLVVFVASTAATWCKERLDVLLVNCGKWSTVQMNQKNKIFLLSSTFVSYENMFSLPMYGFFSTILKFVMCMYSRLLDLADFFLQHFLLFLSQYLSHVCEALLLRWNLGHLIKLHILHVLIPYFNPKPDNLKKKKNLGHTHEMHISINEDSFCSHILGTHLLCVHM